MFLRIFVCMLRQMQMHHWTEPVEAIANVIFVSGCKKSSPAPPCSRKRNLELHVQHTAEQLGGQIVEAFPATWFMDAST